VTHSRVRVVTANWIAAGAALLFLSGCGSPPAESSSSAESGTKWSAPVMIEPASSAVAYGISCPTSTWCMAVDELGNAISMERGIWITPALVSAGGTLTSVSCPEKSACSAVSAGGETFSYDGRSWTQRTRVGPSATYELSCPASTFCAAVGASGVRGGGGTISTFNGNTWSTVPLPADIWPGSRWLDVSCAASTYCVAISDTPNTMVFDGKAWSSVTGSAPGGLLSISCPTAGFCMGVDGATYVTLHGESWSAPHPIVGLQGDFVRSVSCSSKSRCVVLGLGGRSETWMDGGWSAPVLVFPGGFTSTASLSCSPSGTCVAVNGRGLSASN